LSTPPDGVVGERGEIQRPAAYVQHVEPSSAGGFENPSVARPNQGVVRAGSAVFGRVYPVVADAEENAVGPGFEALGRKVGQGLGYVVQPRGHGRSVLLD
jgi:hypothetical protein